MVFPLAERCEHGRPLVIDLFAQLEPLWKKTRVVQDMDAHPVITGIVIIRRREALASRLQIIEIAPFDCLANLLVGELFEQLSITSHGPVLLWGISVIAILAAAPVKHLTGPSQRQYTSNDTRW